jgi:hypothetical protein
MHAERTDSPPLECPRCGYVVDTAIHAARARGESIVVCTECGLDSSIALLESEANCPPWLIESRLGRHRVVSRFLGTLGRSIAPHRFWRAVRMEMPVSRRGLVTHLLGIAIALHVFAFASVAPEVLAEHRFRGTSSLPDLAFAAALPLCPALGSDILRATAQGHPDRSVGAATISRFVAAALRLTVERNPLTILPSVPQAADASGLYAVHPPPPNANAAAVDIVHGLANAQRQMLRLLFLALPSTVATALLMLLPTSLGRARVRRIHIVRAAVYAAILLPASFALHALGSCALAADERLDLVPFGVGRWIAGLATGLTIFAPPIFTIVWMHAVCANYLRLSRAWFITLLLTIMSVLSLLLLMAIANGGAL